jgi:hypothetical protein
MPDYIIVQNRGETQVLEDDLFIHNLDLSQCYLTHGDSDAELPPSIKTIEFTLAIKKETNDVYIVVTKPGTATRYFVEPNEEIKIGIPELDEEVRSGKINISAFGENDLRFELELNYKKNIRVINCSLKRKDFKNIFLLKGVDY